ncbi:MAG: outer membrane protein assembly factor BamA [bacterium]|nr:outer membrane protein assembly factor BamA [bacterium]
MKRILALIFLFLAAPFYVVAESHQIIGEIKITGNDRVQDETVFHQLKSRVGTVFNEETIATDIRSLVGSGSFRSVEVRRLPMANGKVALIFRVGENPAIRSVFIEGNDEVSNDTLKEKLNITARKFLNRQSLHKGIEEAIKHYESKGIQGTEITYSTKVAEPGEVDVTFHVKEGEEKLLRRVEFRGNRAIDSGTLRSEISTAGYRWWSSWLTGNGVIKKEDLSQDVVRIRQYYLRRGYVDISVAEPEVVDVVDGQKLVFRIVEGNQFKVGRISASGTFLAGGEKEILEGTKLESGEIFDASVLHEDSFVIADKYTDIGYAFANVEPQTVLDREKKVVNVTYNIDKGDVIQVNRIVISGNDKTKDNVIRRSLKIGELEQYSSSKVKRSEELVRRLGFFNDVSITPERTEKEKEVDLSVAVTEMATGQFSAGAGISSGDGVLFSVRLSENNLFGEGKNVGLDLNTGSTNQRYVLSYGDPRVNDSLWSFGSDLISYTREYDDFDRKQNGAGISFGYPLWFLGDEAEDDIRFSLGYDLMQIEIDNLSDTAPSRVADEVGKSVSSSVTPSLVRSTIDNPMDPSSGSRQALSVELAGLGGDEKFWIAGVANTFYYPMFDTSFGKFIFSQRTRFNYGDTYNGENLPLFKRFFPGGINSVRGFDARQLGPKDENGNEYGGSKELVANFETIFPLVDSIGFNGVVFYDIGNAFDDDVSVSVSELRQAIGWGIRWSSPIAPIRFEIGYPLDKQEGDSGVVTHFSFGAPL